MRRASVGKLALSCFLVLISALAQAQVGNSSLSGVVSDSSGAAVAHAQVTLHSADESFVRGRTLCWGHQSYRLSDQDFKAASHDGHGQDWPVSYSDMAPFYDLVEDYVGISGSTEGNDALPDGHFLPPMKMTCGEVHFRERKASQFGRTATIGRAAILTQPHNGRAACHNCGPCDRGCITYSYFSSPFTTLQDALKSGKCGRRPCQYGSVDKPGYRRNLCRWHHQADKDYPCEGGDSLRAGIRINPHPVELIHQPPLGRSWQFERSAGSWIDGPFHRSGCKRRAALIQGCSRVV